ESGWVLREVTHKTPTHFPWPCCCSWYRGKLPADPTATLQGQLEIQPALKTPLGTPSHETKICSVLSDFFLGEVSVRRFDTVTANKSRHCNHLHEMIRSCYIRVTWSHFDG